MARLREVLLMAHHNELRLVGLVPKGRESSQSMDSRASTELPKLEPKVAFTRHEQKKTSYTNAMLAVARTRESELRSASLPQQPDDDSDDENEQEHLGPLAAEVPYQPPLSSMSVRHGFLTFGSGEIQEPRMEYHGLELAETWTKQEQQSISQSVLKPTFFQFEGLGSEAELAGIVEGRESQGTYVNANIRGRRLKISLVLHPNMLARLIWDAMSLIMVMYELIVTPFELLEPPSNALFDGMDWILRLFWTFDMVLSFFSGYFTYDGHVEMRLMQIWRRYLRSWFLLDMFIVSADWVELIAGAASGGQNAARLGKAGRITRVVRLLRLLRLLRMWKVAAGIIERLESEKLSILMNMLKITMGIVMWSHLTACIWFGIGQCEGDEICWTGEFDVIQRDLAYKYLTSLHWALSQFTGGMDEVRPTNGWERFYGVCTFLVAFMFAGICTSVLTSSMTRLHLLTSGQQMELIRLRRYLRQSGISNRLAVRVQRNIQTGLVTQYVPESSVKFLELVSRPLRVEMHYEMYHPLLAPHPFFNKYGQDYPHVMQQLCHSAVSKMHVTEGDVIFNLGEKSETPKMYMVRLGRLSYLHTSGKMHPLHEGRFAAEASLWLKWTHQGTLEAKGEADLLEIDGVAFQGILPRFEHKLFDPWKYAHVFLDTIKDAVVSDVFDSEKVLMKSLLRDVRSHSRILGVTASVPPSSMKLTETERLRRSRSLDVGPGHSRSMTGIVPASAP